MQSKLIRDYPKNSGHGNHTIHYIWGDALTQLDPDWYRQIEDVTRNEPHLLTKTREQLEPAVRDGRVLTAVYYKMDKCGGPDHMIILGAIVLWELDRDEEGQMWYELGTFFVARGVRFSQTGLPIGDTLYAQLLALHEDKNILGTTTNVKAVHTGQRHNMQMISFSTLPEAVRHASCICPMSKTGVANNRHCLIKDRSCRVRVSFHTWMRMGRPQRLAYS